MHLADHAACRRLEQARDSGVHEGRKRSAEQARRKAECEHEVLAIRFIDRLRMRHEQSVQYCVHETGSSSFGDLKSSGIQLSICPKFSPEIAKMVENGRNNPILLGQWTQR